jgi:CubicO group peptidase (beta-lactamase class C family)
MILKLKHRSTMNLLWTFLSLTAAFALTSSIVVAQQPESVEDRLKGFDSYMDQVMKDWNAPGIGIGIVMGDKLVFAKGYGFRDYGKKIPYTITTTLPFASNTKLYTAVAFGLLDEDL